MYDWQKLTVEALSQLGADEIMVPGAKLHAQMVKLGYPDGFDVAAHVAGSGYSFSKLVERVAGVTVRERPGSDVLVGLSGAQMPDAAPRLRKPKLLYGGLRSDVFQAFTRISKVPFVYLPGSDRFVTSDKAKGPAIEVDRVGLESLIASRRAQFQSCFIAWVERFTTAVRGVVAVDGKTLRRSFDRAAKQGPIHMISAWSSQQRLVLGQCKVANKSNEITAIPELLQLLELHGAVVTIDAMGCQRTIAAQIIDQKADYVFGLKGNQGTLHKDVALLFDERQDGFAGHAVTLHESFEKGHGRLETRRVVATDDLAWLQKDHQWPGMRSVAKVESRRELLVEGKVEEETRYYISSLPGDAKQIGHAVRSHWGVENGLHWVMDMVFRDDECRIRSAHAPANFATIKHMASNLLRRGKGKHSMRASRHIAGWDEDFLYSLLTT